MKRYIAVIFLLIYLCALLGGCGFWMDGDYVSVRPHQDQSIGTGKEIIEADSEAQIRSALSELFAVGAKSGVIAFSSYNGATAQLYMDSAIQYVLKNDPIGAYAVDKVTYEIGTSGGVEAVAVNISYRRDSSEILDITQVDTMNDVFTIISDSLSNCDPSAVVLVKEYKDIDLVQYIQDYASENPDVIMELPTTGVETYPDKGSKRIIRLSFTYTTSRESLRQMQEVVDSVFTSAELYVGGDAQVREKYAQLYGFLMERFEYTLQTSVTPAYSLLRHGVGDSNAFANVYAAMCRRSNLECYVVNGTRNGTPWTWNLIHFRGRYYHLDLLANNVIGEFQPCSAAEMSGYVWDYSAYPD